MKFSRSLLMKRVGTGEERDVNRCLRGKRLWWERWNLILSCEVQLHLRLSKAIQYIGPDRGRWQLGVTASCSSPQVRLHTRTKLRLACANASYYLSNLSLSRVILAQIKYSVLTGHLKFSHLHHRGLGYSAV
jgi:hypothetical protein